MSWHGATIGDEITIGGKTWVYQGDKVWERKEIDLAAAGAAVVLLKTDNPFFYVDSGGTWHPEEILIELYTSGITIQNVSYDVPGDVTYTEINNDIEVEHDSGDTGVYPTTIKVTVTDTNDNEYEDEITIGIVRQGEKGNTGPQGSTGPKGDKGNTGLQGSTGPQGIQGQTGPQGLKGNTGSQGSTGPIGPKGNT